MRGYGMFFGGVAKRNQPIKLVDLHPVTDHGNKSDTGDAGRDGYTVLTRADSHCQGVLPKVTGEEGPCYFGPDQSFET